MLYEVLIVIYLIVALALIGLILIQQGKGADMGASFGAGSSATIFGASGSGNFLTRTTTILATVFFVISLTLGNLTANKVKATDEWNNLEAPAAAESAEAIKADDVPAAENNSSDVPD